MNNQHLRDHVTQYGSDVLAATAKHFGIHQQLFIRAINGEKDACIEIEGMGKLGKHLTTIMPLIKGHFDDYIKGTEEYNKTLAAVYKQGGESSVAIDKAGAELTLANQKYINKIQEYKTKLFKDLETENEQHNDRMDSIELKAWVDSQTREVDAFANQEAISNEPYIKQIQADRQLADARVKHWLNYGADGDDSLIPEKNYVTDEVQTFWSRVRGIFK